MSSSNKVALAKLCKRHYHMMPIAKHRHRYLLSRCLLSRCLSSRCLSSAFTKISARKAKQSIAFGLLLLASILTTSVSAQTVVNICDRTAVVGVAILAAIPGTPACTAVTSDQLAAITELDLSNMSITALQAGDFDDLIGLTTLRLQGNTFTTPLPANLAVDLPSDALIQIDLTPIDFAIALDTSGMITIDLSDAFISRDDMGDPRTLSYSAIMSANTAVATVTNTGSMVTVTAIGNGATTVSVTANDGVGNVMRTISVTVEMGMSICDRTTQVETAILAAIPSTSDCNLVTAEQLANIDRLGLAGASISTLQANDFAGLSGLTFLSLYNNSLSTLPAGVFDDLTNLIELDFDTNNLSTLPADVFDNLTNLTFLYFDTNNLSALNAGVFDNLTNLTELSLLENNLSTLPADVFDNLTNLTVLDLSSNSLSALNAGVFDNLTNLAALGLSSNMLSALNADVFNNLTNLVGLGLDGNNLSTLPAGLFSGLINLDILLLHDNTFTTPLPADIFADLPSDALIQIDLTPIDFAIALDTSGMITIDLSDAFISRDDMGIDRTLSYSAIMSANTAVATVTNTGSMVTVTVTGNGATTISVTANDGVGNVMRTISVTVQMGMSICDRTSQVERAILAAISETNDCTAVTETQLASIDRLDLRYDRITTLQSGDFAGLSGLTSLDLEGNDLSTLPAGIFDSLVNLESLFFGGSFSNSGNNLSTLPAGIFDNLTNLTELNLRENDLTALPDDVFDNLTNLTELYLSDNNLTALPDDVFDNLANLTILDLDGNFLSALPADVFDNLINLTTLELGGNGLTTLQAGIFDSLVKLESLFLGYGGFSGSGNNLSALPAGIFDNLTSLTSLGLDFNNLSALPAGIFDNLTSLTRLGLDFNNLSALPAGIFDNLTSLTGLGLRNNMLSALPADVFNNLTSLTYLDLSGNTFTTPLPANLFDPISSADIIINLSPIGDLPNVALSAGGTTTINVANAFISRYFDFDGDGLDRNPIYTATSDVTTIATASVSGATVTIVATNVSGGGGVTDVTVTRLERDMFDFFSGVQTATQTFTVTVEAVMDICSRTTQVQTAILAAIPANPACDAVQATDLANITELNLSNSGITSLQSGDFANLASLATLFLNDNNLSALPANLFSGLTSLGTLCLQGNTFTTALAADLFSDLPNTAVIEIDLSPIDILTDVVLSAGDMATIDLSEAFISRDPAGIDRPITYSATSTDSAIATAEVSDAVVTISAAGTGNATVSVTASDSVSGLKGMFTRDIAVTVAVGICDRTDEVEARILDSIPANPTCDAVTETQLASITELYLNRIYINERRITALQSGDFTGLTGLTTLDLGNNELSTLPAGIFDNLRSLTILRLNDNNLSALPAGIFDNLRSLTTLRLNHNNLSALPDNIFDNLTNLTELGLWNNFLSALPADIFDNLTNLTELSLYSNSISALPDDVFDNLGSLTSLSLFNNSLSTLPAGIFDNLTSLIGLSLWSNNLSTLPAGVFNNLTNLTSLGLGSNDLTALEAGVFNNLTNLTSLGLGSNDLTALEAGVFDNLRSLTQLYLWSNNLSALPAGLFDSLTSLTELNLDGNPFTTPLPPDIFNSISSAEIRIGLSPIGDLPGVALTDGGTTTINVTNAFILRSGTSNTNLTIFNAMSNDTNVATTTESNGVVTITGAGMGTTTVSVTVDALSAGTRTRDIAVTVAGTGILAFDEATGNTLANPVVAENSGTDMFYVQLTSAPASDVTLTLTSSDTNEGTVMPGTLTFTAAAGATPWNMRQALTVTAIPDDIDRNDTFTVDFMITDGDGVNYLTTLTLPSVTVLVTDDDTAGLALFDEATGDTLATPVAAENGGTDMVYVELASAPANDVTLTLTSSDTNEGTVSPLTLTFTAAGGATPWNMRQAITVTAVDDDIVRDDSFTVDFSITTGDSGAYVDSLDLPSVPVMISDDDVTSTNITLTVSPETVAETAGETPITVTATLDGAALTTAATVRVSVGSATDTAVEGTDYAQVTYYTLTIPAEMTSGTGTFMLDPTDDTVDDDGETVTVSGTSTGFTTTSTALTISESGILAFEALTGGTSINTVTIDNEASGTNTFYVQLASLPVANVVIGVASNAMGEGTVSPETLTFTTSDWNTRQALTVTAVPDQIDRDDSFMVDFRITSGDGGAYLTTLGIPSVAVTVTDDDTAGIDGYDMATGGSEITAITTSETGDAITTYVELTSEPTGTVTVTIDGIDATEHTLTTPASGTLTFDSTNWNTPRQAITITGVDDTVVDGDQTYTLTLRATGGGYDGVVETGLVTNTDDDTAAISIADLSVDENAGTATLTVTLTPAVTAGAVTVDLTTTDGTATTAGADYTAFTSQTLTITAGETSQTLDIPINDDSIDEADETFTVMLDNLMPPTGVTTVSITDATAEVTITDDDMLSDTINLSVSPLTVAETADATTITVTATIGSAVVLPTATNVMVTVGGGTATSGTDYTAVPSFTLTIPALSSIATQTFIIDPTDDSTDDNNETVMISGTAGGFTTVTPATLTIVEAGISVFESQTSTTQISTTTIAEASGTGMLYVQLTSEPETSSSVTISVASSATGEGIVNPPTLTFSDTDWDDRQAVTVTAVPDNVDRDGDSFTVDFAIMSGDSANYTSSLMLPSVTVTITDDDTVSDTINLSVSPLTVAETADATTITVTATIGSAVVLPTATNVMVTVGGGTATSGTDYTAVPSFTLTIPALSSIATQTFIIDPTDDSTDDNNETVMISGTAGGFTTVTPATLTIVEAGISVFESQTSTTQISTATIAEASSDTFYVELASAPAGNVTLSVTSSNAEEGTVSPGTLTFTNTNWNTRQALTVTAVDDNVDRDDSFTVDFAVTAGDSGAGGNYTNSLDLPSVAVTITDDDTLSDTINLSVSPLSVAETADATTITVTATIDGTAVSSMPTTVTVSVGDVSDSATEGTDYVTVPDFDLTIPALMTSATQTFMIDPTDDTADDNNEVVTISGAAPGFTTVNPATLTIVEAGILVFESQTSTTQISTATIAEASSDTFYVELASEPTGNVTLSVTSDDTNEGIVTPPTLTFTNTNWNTRQPITITAVPDNIDRENDTFMVDFAVTSGDGSNYTSSLMLPSVTVTVSDDDTPSTDITLTISRDSIQETAGETSITVTAALGGAVSTMPTEVTVIVGGTGDTADEDSDYMEIPDFTLTIPALMTSGNGVFTITPIADNENDNEETITISGAASINGNPVTINTATLTITGFSEEEQQVIEQTVAAQASSVTQVVSENIGSFLASRTSAPPAAPAPPAPDGGGDINRENFTSIDWQDWQERFAKLAYEGIKRLDSDADMSLDWALKAAGGDGRLLMPLGVESLTLWAAGGRLKTKGDGMGEYDGGVNSFVVGVDTNLINNWLLGIAASYSDSQVDYTMDGAPIGSNEQNLFSVHPFLSHSLPEHGLTLWVTGGYGVGDIDFSHTTNGEATSDVTQWMAAGGIEKHIITNTLWQGALRLKGLWGNAVVDATEYGNGVDIRKVESTFWRARMESEMGYNFQLPGANVRPYALIGGRWDHNDAIVSGDEWHIDIGGGVEVFSGNAFALNISVHTQLTDGDTEEDSIIGTGSLTYDIGHDRQGLQITLSRPLNNTSPAWDQHSFNELTDKVSGVTSAPLTSELAYGWTVHPFGLEGALQTYIQNSFDSHDRHYAVGLELAVNALTLNFESGYHDHTSLNSGETDNTGLESMLKTKIRW